MTSVRPRPSSETMAVSLLRISERKRSGTVVSASVPCMLSSSDMGSFLSYGVIRAPHPPFGHLLPASGEKVVDGEAPGEGLDGRPNVLDGRDSDRVLGCRFH